MWKSLLKQLNINSLISISHHSETDSQTECFNQKIKTEFCFYMNHLQNNWVCWLSVIEFADNNAVNKFIKITPFYFNKGFSLCMFFSSDITKAITVQEKLQICSVMEIARIMNRILLVACDNLTKAQGDIIKQANCWCCVENFVIKNEVMINIWNFISNWLMRALNDKRCEPFRILQQFHFFYKLNVSSEWYITDIFHINDFMRVTDSRWSPLTEQRNPLPEPAVINDENQTEWMLEEILNLWYSELSCCLQYKVCWTDCDPDFIWYNADGDEFWNVLKALQKYHAYHFNKSDLQFIELKLICHQSTRADWKEIWNVILKVVSDSLLLLYWV